MVTCPPVFNRAFKFEAFPLHRTLGQVPMAFGAPWGQGDFGSTPNGFFFKTVELRLEKERGSGAL